MAKHVILRSWHCLALTESDLIKKCFERYGSVPFDCVPVEVIDFDVPEIGWAERRAVLSQLWYSPTGVKYFENTFEEENERIRLSNLKLAYPFWTGDSISGRLPFGPNPLWSGDQRDASEVLT